MRLFRRHTAVRGLTRKRAACFASLTAGCLVSLLPASARASTDCGNIPTSSTAGAVVGGSFTYGIGGSSQTPLIQALAVALQKAANPVTIVYAAPSACTGLTALLGTSGFTSSATYWDSGGTAHTCTPVAPLQPDFAVTGVFASSCSGDSPLPTGVHDFAGPVLAWDFIVPKSVVDQPAISAEAAYFLYGFGYGAGGNVSPWTSTSGAEVFVRTSTSAAQIAIGQAIGVPAASFKGTSESSNTNMVSAVANAATPESAIGFISSDVADSSSSVTTIAYQHFGQTCGYLPDSASGVHDKANVRDGQYYLWSESHFFTFVNGSGQPVGNSQNSNSVGTAALINSIDSAAGAPLTPQNVLDADISTGNIPQCAMNVWRDTDLGPLYSYQPPAPCECYFQFKATGTTSCSACSTSASCPGNAPVCRYGYCEVQ
jgi:hypothetical protein